MAALRLRAQQAHRCRQHRSLKLDPNAPNFVTKQSYDPDHALTDGDADVWNVDCDLVTHALGNDWYYKAMECGGDLDR